MLRYLTRFAGRCLRLARCVANGSNEARNTLIIAALSHNQTPCHMVGLAVVQVEFERDGPGGKAETQYFSQC